MKRLMEESGINALLAYTSEYALKDQMDLESMAARKLYFQDWQGKSLDRYADYTNRVIQKYLALAAAETDPEQAQMDTQFANVMSYNLSATWPNAGRAKRSRRRSVTSEWGWRLPSAASPCESN